jgi:rhodanese-related sulfurtransferase
MARKPRFLARRCSLPQRNVNETMAGLRTCDEPCLRMGSFRHNRIRMVLGVIALLLAPLATSPAQSDGSSLSKPRFAHLSVEEVARFLGRPGVYVFDVNLPEIWANNHLPGAIHITDPDLKHFLPSDHHAILIFYCAASRCSASDAAARQAVRLGYTRVYVMPEGIFGWIRAGERTEKAARSDRR